MVLAEIIEYKGIQNCIRLTNQNVELIAMTHMGPRILRFGFIDGPNMFYENMDQILNPDTTEWCLFGGHRLWFAPEVKDLVSQPDLQPVAFELFSNGFTLHQQVEPHNGLQKSITVTMSDDGGVELTHKITNRGLWPVEIGLWSLSVLCENSLGVVKFPDRDTGYLSNRTLVLWPYTKMNDTRVTWGDKYIFLRQDPSLTDEDKFKFGIPNEHGWAAGFNHGNMFVKRHIHVQNETYPDNNCSYETFTDGSILELETLGPVVKLNPGDFDEHYESWNLYSGIPSPTTESDMDAILFQFGGEL